MLRKAGVTPHDSPSLWDGKNVIFAGRAGHGVNLLTFKLPSYLGRAFGRPQALTTSGGFQAVPAKLSDGRILFADWREQSHIWKVNPSTGQPSQLTFQDSIDTKVSCSRDGSVIVFGRRLGDVRNVWTKDLRVGVERELAANELAVPFVSPSGRKTALSAGVTMRILEMATGKQSVVCTSCGELMSWVPDESGLLFLIESDEHTAEIKKLDLRTNSSKTLISGEGLREASLSPNGRTIAFTARQAGVRSRIFIQSLGDGAVGSRWKPVTDKDGWADKPVWSNDGRTLFYNSRRDGFRCIWSQRIKSDMSGPDGGPKAILHLHKPTFTLSHYSNTALGLAGAAGSLFLTVDSAQSNIWAVQP
jgi:Tol biopolymer transport system component